MKAGKCPLFVLSLIALAALAVFQLALPDKTMSEMENRALSTAPKLSAQSVLSGRFMSSCEDYIADQIPLRDAFVSAYALYEAALQKQLRNGILIGECGYMFETGKSISEKLIYENAVAAADIAKATDIKGYICLAPLSSSVYSSYAPRYAKLTDGAAMEKAAQTDGMEVIPLLNAFASQTGDSALYYKTDHHWTALGAEKAYNEICAAFGIEAIKDGEIHEIDGFYGSYFARSPSPLQPADTLTYYDFKDAELYIGKEKAIGLVDKKALNARDKYSALLFGNHAIITLVNANQSGTLFVIKDSYGNALLPYLSQNFGTIYAVDPRYYTGNILSEIRESGASALLCVYGINTFGENRDMITLAADAMEEK